MQSLLCHSGERNDVRIHDSVIMGPSAALEKTKWGDQEDDLWDWITTSFRPRDDNLIFIQSP